MLRLREGGPQEGFSTTNVTQNLGKKYSQNLFTAPISLRSECALRGHLQDITGGKVNMPYPNSLSPCATESVIHLVVPLSILLWEESSWRKLKSLDSKKKKNAGGSFLSLSGKFHIVGSQQWTWAWPRVHVQTDFELWAGSSVRISLSWIVFLLWNPLFCLVVCL